MANNYTPRRAAPSGEPERRRTAASRRAGLSLPGEKSPPGNGLHLVPTPDRHGASQRRLQRTPGLLLETCPARAPRDTRSPAPPGSPAPCGKPARNGTLRAPHAPDRRRRKKRPAHSAHPVLVLLLVIVRGDRLCGAGLLRPTGGWRQLLHQLQLPDKPGKRHRRPAPPGRIFQPVSGTDSSAPVSSAVSEAPTPAPQEEPQAAPEHASAACWWWATPPTSTTTSTTDLANQYITAVADAGEKLSGISTLYDMVIPTSIDIDLPESYIDRNQPARSTPPTSARPLRSTSTPPSRP